MTRAGASRDFLASATLSLRYAGWAAVEAGGVIGHAITRVSPEAHARAGVSLDLFDGRREGQTGWVFRLPVLAGYRFGAQSFGPSSEFCAQYSVDWISAATLSTGLEAVYFGRSRGFSMRLLGGAARRIASHAGSECSPGRATSGELAVQLGVVF